jgi:ribose 5-phosphate isomerase B
VTERVPTRRGGSQGRPDVLTAEDVRALRPGSVLELDRATRITDLGLDEARSRNIRLRRSGEPPAGAAALARLRQAINRTGPLALGSDHAGFELKSALKTALSVAGHPVVDLGVFSPAAADYPDIAARVARSVARGECARGILVDGAGVGSAIAANKIAGARAAFCPDPATARNCREHNGANILCLGAKALTLHSALPIVTLFLQTELTEERHLLRVAKILALEGAPEFAELKP